MFMERIQEHPDGHARQLVSGDGWASGVPSLWDGFVPEPVVPEPVVPEPLEVSGTPASSVGAIGE